MDPILTLISSPPYIEWPRGAPGWVGWLALLGVNIFLLLRWRKYNRPRLSQSAWLLVVLLLSTPLTSLLLGLRFPLPGARSSPLG